MRYDSIYALRTHMRDFRVELHDPSGAVSIRDARASTSNDQ
jgi:hypothetical protein